MLYIRKKLNSFEIGYLSVIIVISESVLLWFNKKCRQMKGGDVNFDRMRDLKFNRKCVIVKLILLYLDSTE